MRHPFMHGDRGGFGRLRRVGVAVPVPLMETGSGRPRPGVAHQAVRAAVSYAAGLAPELPLFAARS